MSAIILRDEIVHYEVLGRGRPLIFLHGWVGSWRYWIPTMQAASTSFRTYALDMWGFGDTAKNRDRYSIESQIRLLDDFLREMGIGKIALIGHGLGAVVGLSYARRNPHLVDRLIAVSMPDGRQSINSRMWDASPEELAGWLLNRTPDGDAARVEAPKADRQAIQCSLDEILQAGLGRLPWKLTTSCLLVYGQNDPAVTIAPATGENTLPPHMHQVLFEASGHFPMLDEASKFNRLMADFLALASGVSPQQLQLKEEWKRRVR